MFFDPSIIIDLKNDQRDCVLCIEKKKTIEEEMKVEIKNNNIIKISKEIDCQTADGEFTGVAKISPKVAPTIRNAIKNRIEIKRSLDAFSK